MSQGRDLTTKLRLIAIQSGSVVEERSSADSQATTLFCNTAWTVLLAIRVIRVSSGLS